MTIFQLSDIETEKMAAVARDLTTLRLYPYVTKGDDGSEYAKQSGCLGRLLGEAKGLRNLSSSSWALDYEGLDEDLVWNERPADFGLFLGKQWPHLTKLTLKEACVEARDLMMILRAHTESLCELRLVGIRLLGKEGWEHLGKKIGQILKLHSVCVSQLYDEVIRTSYHTWPRGEEGFLLIRDMIQWALPSLLEIEEKRNLSKGSTFTGTLKASRKTDC